MRRLMILTTLLLATPSAAAHAAGPPLGAKILWPKAGEVAPGATVRLGVVPRTRGRAVPVRLTVLRLGAADGGVVAKRVLRRGRLSVRLARQGGARYLLRAEARGRRVERRLQTAAPCPDDGPAAASMALSAGRGRPGDRLVATISNTGRRCLSGGLGYGWDRQLPDGSWERIEKRDLMVPAMAVQITVGGRLPLDVLVWRELSAPGRYRLVTAYETAAGERVTATAPFEVLPEDPPQRPA